MAPSNLRTQDGTKRSLRLSSRNSRQIIWGATEKHIQDLITIITLHNPGINSFPRFNLITCQRNRFRVLVVGVAYVSPLSVRAKCELLYRIPADSCSCAVRSDGSVRVRSVRLKCRSFVVYACPLTGSPIRPKMSSITTYLDCSELCSTDVLVCADDFTDQLSY